jgi:cytochrome P450
MLARDEETGEGLSEQEIHDEAVTLFLAGHETSGTGLAWTLYLVSQHPEVRRKVEEEVDTVLGGRAPVVADLRQMTYTRMVVDESLRMCPPIWAFPRDAIEDDEIGGYHIPAGSSIFLLPYVTHRHPAFWENPEAFDPERFNPERPSSRPRFAYFPFGGGQRQCVGMHLALLELQVGLAMVSQRFRLHAVPGHPIELRPRVSLRPIHGIRMTLHPRVD